MTTPFETPRSTLEFIRDKVQRFMVAFPESPDVTTGEFLELLDDIRDDCNRGLGDPTQGTRVFVDLETGVMRDE